MIQANQRPGDDDEVAMLEDEPGWDFGPTLAMSHGII